MSSFKELLDIKLFEQRDDEGVSDVTIQLAAAILMFEVVKADGDIDTMEVAEMVDILRTQFALKSNEIRKLMEAVHAAGEDDIQLASFAAKLCKHWGQRERVRLLKDFWVIALADDNLEDKEKSLIDRIAQMLKLDEEEITRARFHAEQKIELKIG